MDVSQRRIAQIPKNAVGTLQQDLRLDDHPSMIDLKPSLSLICRWKHGSPFSLLSHSRGVEAADPARGYGWIKLAAIRGDDLAKANLQDPLFTPSVRAAGLAQLAYIQSRLLTVPSDPQAILRDPWY
jgi:hypothetical protein